MQISLGPSLLLHKCVLACMHLCAGEQIANFERGHRYLCNREDEYIGFVIV